MKSIFIAVRSEKMYKKLVEEIANYKGIAQESISAESNLILDLGISSMELVEILLPFEELVEFSDEAVEAFNFETVGELAEFLETIKI